MSKDKYLNEAKDQLMLASNEVNKPEEDIVSFSVCKHAQSAIKNFMYAYLEKNGAIVDQSLTLGDLLQSCKNIDPKFDNIDFNGLNCMQNDIELSSCEDISQVNLCYKTADALDNFLRFRV